MLLVTLTFPPHMCYSHCTRLVTDNCPHRPSYQRPAALLPGPTLPPISARKRKHRPAFFSRFRSHGRALGKHPTTPVFSQPRMDISPLPFRVFEAMQCTSAYLHRVHMTVITRCAPPRPAIDWGPLDNTVAQYYAPDLPFQRSSHSRVVYL